LKAEGYLSQTEIGGMSEVELVAEVEEFSRYCERKNDAQRRAST